MPTKITALFEDGQTAAVQISLHQPPSGNSRPIDAYMVKEFPGAVNNAAKMAAETAFAWASCRNQAKPVVVAFDLYGLAENNQVGGGSCGLAFAIAAATALLKENPAHIAATGVIQNSSGGGPVSAVSGIKHKLDAAIEMLPEKGLVFYPAANKDEVTNETRKHAAAKKIELIEVKKVFDALAHLYSKPEQTSGGKLKSALFIGAAVCLVLAGLYSWSSWGNDFSGKKEEVTKQPQQVQQQSSQPVEQERQMFSADIKGDGELEKSLASMLNEKLGQLLDGEFESDNRPPRLTGEIFSEKLIDNRASGYEGERGIEIRAQIIFKRHNNAPISESLFYRNTTATPKPQVVAADLAGQIYDLLLQKPAKSVEYR